MKKVVFLSGLLMLVSSTLIFAQLSKDELKQWKKTKKAMDLEEFKNMVEENSSLKEQLNQMKGDYGTLESEVQQRRDEVANLQTKVQNLEQNLAEARTMDVSGDQPENNTKVAKGVVFKVQIGAFRNKDLSKYFSSSDNFGGEVDPDGTQRYTLGNFTDYWKADKFKKYLREMGVKDAWIVPYKDGRRVPMKDVLEGVI